MKRTRVKNKRKGLISGGCLITVLVLTLFAPVFTSHDPYAQNLENILAPPMTASESDGGIALLGTDQLGRDVLSRLLYGGRTSLLVGVVSAILCGMIGSALGVVAGYYRRVAGVIIMRLADINLSVPTMLMAIMIVAVLGSTLFNTILVLTVTGWVSFARVVRSETLSLRERNFVEAARAMGVSNFRVITRHILPNLSHTVITLTTLQIARMILLSASLSFLGLGIDVSSPSWGGMINDGRNYIMTAPWLSAIPGAAIAFTLVGINIFSDWLHENLG
ncbi:MAG: ABC transporter permease [Synergistaceae bacterium]|jgi:peptide/nickel transport system permease protein|nr:ABC transporter permease [Synergistaceae bacterium]